MRPALVGLAGPHLSGEERELLARLQPCGVLLFRRNVESVVQLRALCAQLRELLGAGVWIAADQEGGAVAVLSAAVEPPPSALALGLADDPGLTERVYRRLGSEARGVGVNVVLAPVADVVVGEQSVLATRAFGSDAMSVARHVTAALHGLAAAGVVACVKHWPGHGRPRADSHHELPLVDATLEQLLACELVPFVAALEAGAPTLMVGHLRVPALDASECVATESPIIVHDWLRRRLNFDGIVLADAIEMASAPAAAAMLAAGCDLLLFARPIEEIAAAIEALPTVADRERFARILRRADVNAMAAVQDGDVSSDYAQARRHGLAVLWQVQRGQGEWPFFAGRQPSLSMLDLASGDRLVVEAGRGVDPLSIDRHAPPASIYAAGLRDWIDVDEFERRLQVIAPRAPLERLLEAVAALPLQETEVLVLAALRPWPRAAAAALRARLERAPQLRAVVLLGDPSPERWLGPDPAVVLVPGVRGSDLAIALDLLRGRIEAVPRDRWGG